MLGNLQQFQPPENGAITLCEVEGRIHSMPFECADVRQFTATIDRHPKVHITQDILHPLKLADEGKDLLLPVPTTYLKQLTQIYWEQGFEEAVNKASTYDHIVISQTAVLLLKAINRIKRIKQLFNPYAIESTHILIAEYVQTKNWYKSSIRAIAWHPDTTKIAVAAADDVVRIYDSENSLLPILKSKQQKNVSCLAWRPMSNAEIAVACEFGIIIWNVDPNSMVTRPSMNHAIILSCIEHKPVLSISWSPMGDILASVAVNDPNIVLWHPEMNQRSSLKRPGTFGHHLLKWSSAGDKLFAATTLYVFRVWNCVSWKADRWSVLCGRVQACCWSPCGKYLLFSTNAEPNIYLLSFNTSDLLLNASATTGNEAVPLFDVSKVDLNGILVGGCIRSLEWDCKGRYIAALFQDCNVIVVFSVFMEPAVQLLPGFIINGHPDEMATTMQFQKNFVYGACLTIGWSSGRLQHFPIVYSDKLLSSVDPQRSSNVAL